MKLLIVEDSPRLRVTLGKSLSKMGYAVDMAEDGYEGDAMARASSYDVIVLDRMLPGKDGLEVLRDWRREGIETPVLLLTALDGTEEKVRGLGYGADDYLTKPFALEELAARLEALARRFHAQPNPVVELGGLEIDFVSKSVSRNGTPLNLSAREFSLLECLARRPGQVLSRGQIEEYLYGESESPLSNAVDAAVYALRRKIEANGGNSIIRTRRGFGYVLEV